MKTDQNRIYIFDTTLRDGQQSPGAGMSLADNLQYAEYAAALHVDVLEAGFPAASVLDFQIVQKISENMANRRANMIIAALCQLREEQFVKTMEALAPSVAEKKARVHTYLPVDPHLMQASLGQLSQDKDKILTDLFRLTKMAVDAGYEVEFSPEGYSRMGENFDFVSDLIRATVSAGARVINCPDTIGGAARIQGEAYFVNHMKKHAAIIAREFPQRNVIWSAHCHNDFGLALDNSISAVFEGPARQIEGCINGVGERAGNVALEQCIMYIQQFGAAWDADNPYHTHIQMQHLKEISDFVAEKMLERQPHYPIVGKNSARHSSGGHTNAILKNPQAYQPFDPQIIGSEISFVFGPLSGSNHAKEVIEKHGYVCTQSEKVALSQSIKDFYADRRKGITEEELLRAYKELRAPIQVTEISYSKANYTQTTLVMTGKFFDREKMVVHYEGTNSALAALAKAVEEFFPDLSVVDYRSNSCEGETVNAKCYAKIVVAVQEQPFVGEAIDADIEISALKAFIDAVNQAYVELHYRITGSTECLSKEKIHV